MLWYGVMQPKFFPRPPTPPPVRRSGDAPDRDAAGRRRLASAASRPAVDLAMVKPVVLENENLRLTFSTQGADADQARS